MFLIVVTTILRDLDTIIIVILMDLWVKTELLVVHAKVAMQQ